MSESQTEYETGIEPTPGPWEVMWYDDRVAIDMKGYDAEIAELTGVGAQTLANARLIAAAGTAAHELPDEYDATAVLEIVPDLLRAAEEGGPVADALCELKAAADYIEEETGSTLGAGRLHRIADEAADAIGLKISTPSSQNE